MIDVACTEMGVITAETPRMSRILNRLEPITLPMAISFCPLRAATIEVTSSGRLVPMATIVRPMSVSLRPNMRAMPVAPFTAS